MPSFWVMTLKYYVLMLNFVYIILYFGSIIFYSSTPFNLEPPFSVDIITSENQMLAYKYTVRMDKNKISSRNE